MIGKSITIRLFILVLICCFLQGCTRNDVLDSKNPVTLTLWHNYGGVMQSAMDQLVDNFNSTVGKEKGIIVTITSINSSSALNDKIIAAATKDPGAPELPNITTCYPAIAVHLAEKDLLIDFYDYFSDTELSEYVEDFIREGVIDQQLRVFPVAKSTEVLFLNQTLFDRFSEQTGVSIEQLSTFEGICRTAKIYYEWTDASTPDTPGNGKAFFAIDSLFNFFQVGMEQLGQSFTQDQALVTAGNIYQHIHDTLFEPAVQGGYAIYNGYSTDLSKTGDIVCSTGSTAGILFYGDKIVYPDNTSETVEYSVFPYPVFQGGEKIAVQRGNGMTVIRSSEKEEYASVEFIKWFTRAEQNLRFVMETGYLPVTKTAFDQILEGTANHIENVNIQKLLSTAIKMQHEYRFLIPPTFNTYDQLRREFEDQYRTILKTSRDLYIEKSKSTDRNTAFQEVKAGQGS